MISLNKIDFDKNYDQIKEQLFNQLYRAVKPAFILSKCFGLLPTVQHNSSTELDVTKDDWIYMYFFGMIYFCLYMYNMKIAINEEIVLYVSKFTQGIFVFTAALNTGSIVIFNYLKRAEVARAFNVIAEVDCLLNMTNLKLDYTNLRKRILREISFMLGLFVFRTVIFNLITEIYFSQQLLLNITIIIKFAFMFEFFIFIVLICGRFDEINNAVRAYNEVKFTKNNIQSATKKLYLLCRSHFKLCDVVHILNMAFGFQLLIIIIMSILNFLAQFYFLYVICSDNVNNSTVKLMAITIWFVGDFIEIFTVIKYCTDACDNAGDFAICLHELQNTCEYPEFEGHIQIYSLQVLHQKIYFSALGFFEFDFTLIYAIVGTVLTFLVMVVQHDQSLTAAANAAANAALQTTTLSSSSDFTTTDYFDNCTTEENFDNLFDD